MNRPTNICPLLAIAGIGTTSGSALCLGERCAWWDFCGSECVMITAATALGEVAANLEDMQQKTAASNSNTDND